MGRAADFEPRAFAPVQEIFSVEVRDPRTHVILQADDGGIVVMGLVKHEIIHGRDDKRHIMMSQHVNDGLGPHQDLQPIFVFGMQMPIIACRNIIIGLDVE